MALVFSETFTTEIPSGFATAYHNNPSFDPMLVTYNSTEQAVDLVSNQGPDYWKFDTIPSISEGRIILDVEIVDSNNFDTYTNKFGLGFKYGSGSTSLIIPYFWTFTNNSADLTYTWNSGFTSFASVIKSVSNPMATGRALYEFIISVTEYGAIRIISKEDGTTILEHFISSTPPNIDYTPSIIGDLNLYLYVDSCAIRLHSIEIHDDMPAAFTHTHEYKSQVINFTAPYHPYPTPSIIYKPFQIDTNKRIYGYIKISGDPTDVPTQRKVRLYNETTGVIIAETWSNPTTGYYEFIGLNDIEKYTVVTYDYLHNYSAVVADNRSAVV